MKVKPDGGVSAIVMAGYIDSIEGTIIVYNIDNEEFGKSEDVKELSWK